MDHLPLYGKVLRGMLIKSHTLNEILTAKHEKLIGASYSYNKSGASYSYNKSDKFYPGLKYEKR